MKEGLGNMFHYVISNTSIHPNIKYDNVKYDTFHKCPKDDLIWNTWQKNGIAD